ncbi:MAG TPA: AAA family ATPase [Candidatus Polarisedimenticolaceae bacterium]|nr:AAA family ATPase [Candidatus Polarisedimenticolaceae bacterium]
MTGVSSGISVLELRISNFRSFRNVSVRLGDLTLLVGANNAGKTNLLDAINVALGAGRKLIGVDDIHTTFGEPSLPKDRKAVVDVLIRPIGEDGAVLDSFPAGSFWTALWGHGIAQDSAVHDFVGIRTTLMWDPVRGEYALSRKFLKDWKPFADWLGTEEAHAVVSTQIEPMAVSYIDAQRDLENDLRARGSFWRRLTDDLGLSDAEIKDFEAALTKLNEELVSKSGVLTHIHQNLVNLEDVIAAKKAGINISPVPRTLRDLSRGVDVTLSTPGAQPFPLAKHGMGTRSLASLLVFRAYVEWKKKQAEATGDAVHAFLALEEPEAHLHPQAQRALYHQIATVSAQRLLSTHSPYISGQAGLADLRLIGRTQSESTVAELDLSKITDDERRAVERQVVATRGDLLFSRALILYEGIVTEELVFPIWANAYWGKTVHELGFSFVGVAGHNYFPFVWLAESFGIPWFIYSDGEDAALKQLSSSLAKIGIADYKTRCEVTVIPEKGDIEAELVRDGYLPQIEEALARVFEPGFIDQYIKEHNGRPGPKKAGVEYTRDYTSAGGRERAAIDALRGNKGSVATSLAEVIAALPDAARRVPTTVAQFFAEISKRFDLSRS